MIGSRAGRWTVTVYGALSLCATAASSMFMCVIDNGTIRVACERGNEVQLWIRRTSIDPDVTFRLSGRGARAASTLQTRSRPSWAWQPLQYPADESYGCVPWVFAAFSNRAWRGVNVTLWPHAALGLSLACCAWRAYLRGSTQLGMCPKCSYDVSSGPAERCPECGFVNKRHGKCLRSMKSQER